jgi:hypothetical protein
VGSSELPSLSPPSLVVPSQLGVKRLPLYTDVSVTVVDFELEIRVFLDQVPDKEILIDTISIG